MTWDQHRYAVERARDFRRKLADEQNEAAQGVNLQGEANGSDAEMLDEVADFLRSRDAVTKLPPEALRAWVEFEPIGQFAESMSFARFNGMLRHAFMSGFLASREL